MKSLFIGTVLSVILSSSVFASDVCLVHASYHVTQYFTTQFECTDKSAEGRYNLILFKSNKLDMIKQLTDDRWEIKTESMRYHSQGSDSYFVFTKK